MAGHVYCTVAEADNYETSDGASKYSAQGASVVALKLGILESVSRLLDEKCERSDFGSGFGPRVGTNHYDGAGRNYLRLRDDLLSATTITMRLATRDSGTILPAADTDYFLMNADGAYEPGPYRKMLLHRYGIVSAFGYGYKVTDILGVWGLSNVTVPTGITVTSGLAADATVTTFAASVAGLSPGMTLLVGTEQIYVSDIGSTPFTTTTIVRGCNGTTAAVHANASPIARYTYPAQAHETALRLYQRRYRARDAGADGTEEGLNMPGRPQMESEDTIIRRGMHGLRLKEMV